jgi:hypothetical protein
MAIFKCKRCKCTFEINILFLVETVSLCDVTEDVTIQVTEEEVGFCVCASCGHHDLEEVQEQKGK